MKPRKPAPGELWQSADGSLVLVAGVDSTHVVVCSVAQDWSGRIVAHPRGRKAMQVLSTVFSAGRYEHVGIAKAASR